MTCCICRKNTLCPDAARLRAKMLDAHRAGRRVEFKQRREEYTRHRLAAGQRVAVKKKPERREER